jgi:hypothetical protein
MDDEPAHFGSARNGHLIDARMGGKDGSSSFAEPWHDIDHAIRQAGFQQKFAQLQRRQRRFFGDLEYNGAAGRKRRRQFPRHHQ